MRIKPILLHVAIPLLVGGFIYIAFRSNTLEMFRWFEAINLSGVINQIRESSKPVRKHIPVWVFNSLPDGLWVYSYSSTYILYFRDKSWKNNYWLLFPLLFGSVAEIAQALNLVAGTFDYLDLIFCLSGSLLSIILNFKNEKQISKNYRGDSNFRFFCGNGIRLRGIGQ